ncbi:uncharacterized protein BYT42DRAFT_506219 [Radiomyces spectabilis]|uniref:uncharacterized protein n=1 Tax=Radiomyces spectabilis TaxID=64574 RepID=UPI00221F7D2D|nr:uncharacterized protein BYT42DRAFT_506219 [Radiomyces spectabilis]KAI8364712.1 hypothetical protein BYT42DRAFT_506219 [Radiomyces spectabilis]
MDVVTSQYLCQIYIYCYEQLLQWHIPLPEPETVFDTVRWLAQLAWEHSPDIIQRYYMWLIALPLQPNVLPVFLILVILYTLFSLVMFAIRGLFRVAYGFLRFTLLVTLLVTLFLFTQQYLSPTDTTA